MLTLIVAAIGVWSIVAVAPETTIGRALRHWTVDRPAARLSRITRGHVLLAILLLTGVSLVGWTLGHEAVRLIAMGLPELTTWVTMFEVSAYLDAIAAIVTAASITRIDALRGWIVDRIRPRRATMRAPRRPAATVDPANDDEDSRSFARAA